MYDLKMHWATPESGETKIPGVCRNFCESLRKRMEQVGRKDCERQRLASGKEGQERAWGSSNILVNIYLSRVGYAFRCIVIVLYFFTPILLCLSELFLPPQPLVSVPELAFPTPHFHFRVSSSEFSCLFHVSLFFILRFLSSVCAKA